jgi:hypothetical protein
MQRKDEPRKVEIEKLRKKLRKAEAGLPDVFAAAKTANAWDAWGAALDKIRILEEQIAELDKDDE